MFAWALLPLVALYAAYALFTQALGRFFLVPPHEWQDKIRAVVRHDKPIYLKVGYKRSSFRRRLVTASEQPSYYTNYVNNKLKIFPADAANEDAFMARMKIRDANDPNRRLVYGFFHPYANNGGGGEKVLWHAVLATLLEDPRNVVAVYTTNVDAEPLAILRKAAQKFAVANLDSSRIVFVYLRRYARLIDDAAWPRFTLVGQLVGSMALTLEALFELTPDVWVDTMGLPASYWIVLWSVKIPIIAYVHFPILQDDMFSKLKVRSVREVLAGPTLADVLAVGKYAYWSCLLWFYAFLGHCVDVTFANGTWTHERIAKVWRFNKNKHMSVLYPPCSTENLVKSSGDLSAPRSNRLLYVAQFRPEKRHLLILHEYKAFLDKFRSAKAPALQLPTVVLLGSCRTPTDSATLDALRAQVKELDVEEYVEFVVDSPFDVVKQTLQDCKFGLNGMWNEHFGIGVVEYLSSGCVPIVHASAGPLLDIVKVDEPSALWSNELGYFFKSETDPDYAGSATDGQLAFTLQGKPATYPTLAVLLATLFIEQPELARDDALEAKRLLGRQLMLDRFSDEKFAFAWTACLRSIAALEAHYRDTRRDKVDQVH